MSERTGMIETVKSVQAALVSKEPAEAASIIARTCQIDFQQAQVLTVAIGTRFRDLPDGTVREYQEDMGEMLRVVKDMSLKVQVEQLNVVTMEQRADHFEKRFQDAVERNEGLQGEVNTANTDLQAMQAERNVARREADTANETAFEWQKRTQSAEARHNNTLDDKRDVVAKLAEAREELGAARKAAAGSKIADDTIRYLAVIGQLRKRMFDEAQARIDELERQFLNDAEA